MTLCMAEQTGLLLRCTSPSDVFAVGWSLYVYMIENRLPWWTWYSLDAMGYRNWVSNVRMQLFQYGFRSAFVDESGSGTSQWVYTSFSWKTDTCFTWKTRTYLFVKDWYVLFRERLVRTFSWKVRTFSRKTDMCFFVKDSYVHFRENSYLLLHERLICSRWPN